VDEHIEKGRVMSTVECILVDENTLEVDGTVNETARINAKPNGKFYVSFYHELYRHWVNWVEIGKPFSAKRTRDYQFAGGRNSNARAVRDERARQSNARWSRRTGRSMYF
jgi:hypothetical protein